ncbi:MAG: GNAT family N-acetyltransferase [Streptosporangiaceae bacterium]|nr:GNAT family N-acetyltransferase [Streptosporangiaceae bacterium]
MTRQNAAAGPASHAIIPASTSDVDMLSHVIADAFHPLDVSRWLIPDEAERRKRFPAYFRMYVEHAMADGLVHTTPGRTAAALWIPGTGPAAAADGYAGQLAEITGPWVERFQVFDDELERHHLSGAEHHHLAILAVRPDRQGHGVGTALLSFHHAVLDEKGVPAYLEASAADTRRIYLAHGYADFGTPIRLPGGPEMYPMLRQPAGSSNAR